MLILRNIIYINILQIQKQNYVEYFYEYEKNPSKLNAIPRGFRVLHEILGALISI